MISLILIVFCIPSKAIDLKEPDSLRTYQRADVSFIFGGQIYNDNFLYNPGFAFQGSFGIMLNESAGLGIGAGHQIFSNEKFIPLFIEAIGYKTVKRNTPFIKMQAGYSIGWYTGTTAMEGYDYSGGLYFDAGIGRRFPVGRSSSILFHGSYRHQCARIEYQTIPSHDYTQKLNYDMIVILLGFHFINN